MSRHVRDVFGAGIPDASLTLLVPPGDFARVATAAGHDVIVAPFGPAHGLSRSLRSLRNAIDSSGAEIVHSHLAFADFAVALVPGRSVARVSTEHGIAADDRVYHSSWARSRGMALAHRLRLRRFDALIAVSHATARAMQVKWRPPRRLRVEVVANGVDIPMMGTPPVGKGLHVAALSRLAPEKGLMDLLDAFAIVHAEHPEAHLTIAGAGPMRSQIETRVSELGLTDAIELVGVVEGMDALAPVHVLVQLSVWENCSYALLDALVAGCGIVATDVGGNPEILPARCLVRPGDVSDAADRIITQALHPAARPSLRDGWPTVRAMCTDLSSVYERVTA